MYINNILNKYIEPKYKIFQEKICPTKYEILGIKIPILRKISKELLKDYSFEDIINNLNNTYFEHIMLEGLLIANLNEPYEKKLELIDKFLPKIDNWAICDIFVSELKFIKNNQEKFLEFITPLFQSKKEYFLRFSIVVILNYYINDEYINFVLNKMLAIKSDYYYVKMAISWCLSICLVKYFDITLNFLNKNKLNFDKWTYNKALQKGRESLKIPKDKKDLLKNMKLK